MNVLPPLLIFYRELANVLDLVETAVELLSVDLPLAHSHAFLYNTQSVSPQDPWASGSDSGQIISPRKLLSGYASIWVAQLNGSPAALNKIVKAAVWITEQRGSLREGLDYIFDLNRSGFIIGRGTLFDVSTNDLAVRPHERSK